MKRTKRTKAKSAQRTKAKSAKRTKSRTKRTKIQATKVPALSHTQIVVVLNEKVRADEPFTHNELHEWLVNEPINKLIRDGYVEDAGDGRIRVTEKGRKLKGPVPETAED